MKKIMKLLTVFIFILSLLGCSQFENKDGVYKLEIVDNWNLLVHPLEEEYESGSIIEVHLHFRSGPAVGIIINDEVLIAKETSTTCNGYCDIVRFTMPKEDTVIYTHQNGEVSICSK